MMGLITPFAQGGCIAELLSSIISQQSDILSSYSLSHAVYHSGDRSVSLLSTYTT